MIVDNEILPVEEIKNLIFSIRGFQVMVDADLAELYGVETKRLNEQVKRNLDRFPKGFYFQLTDAEYESLRTQNATLENESFLRSQIATSNPIVKNISSESYPLILQDTKSKLSAGILRSQNATLENGRGKHRKFLPYVFTEQGVAMLSAVLKSETAVKMSIQIINAFVAMRHFLISNAQVFQRLESLEIKQLDTDRKLNQVLDAFQQNEIQPKEGIFFDGQIFDAYKFACDLIRKATKSITLIDNYIDDSVLDILTKRKENVSATIYTKSISKQLNLDLEKHNKQYPKIELMVFEKSHDRFLIIDENEVYHIGASLKDLGKKWFAFSKMSMDAFNVLKKLKGK